MQSVGEVVIGGKPYIIKELTIKQIAELVDLQSKDIGGHVIDMLFGDVISARAISMSSGISMDDLANLTDTPSKIIELIDCVKEQNSFLSKALERKKTQEEENLKKMLELGPEVVKNLISMQLSAKK